MGDRHLPNQSSRCRSRMECRPALQMDIEASFFPHSTRALLAWHTTILLQLRHPSCLLARKGAESSHREYLGGRHPDLLDQDRTADCAESQQASNNPAW